MSNCWKRMSSGKYIDMENFTLGDVDISDIEVSLNKIIRFTGHYADVNPLTVAQHSMLCLSLARKYEPDNKELHRAVFAHDFAEAYIGDVSTPVKRAMGDKWYKFAKPIEESVEIAVHGYLLDPYVHERVKIYDLAALDIERRVMWSSPFGKSKWPDSPLNVGTTEDKLQWFWEVASMNVAIGEVWEWLQE